MRMTSNCYPCILDRAKFECDLVFAKEEEKKEAAPVERNDCSRNRLPGQLVKRKVEKEESSRSQARNRNRRKRRNSSTGKTQR